MATWRRGGRLGLLAGSVVVITGPARGIGEQLARQAVARGARVGLLGLEPQRLADLAAELNRAARSETRAAWWECDVTDQASLDAAVAEVAARFGGIDVVVANAGVANLGTVARSPVQAVVRTIEVNLVGVARTVSATLPHLIASRGYLLLMSSAAAFTVLPGMAAYCAAKAGVEQFGNAVRLEVAHLGVRVGVAHPGWIDTDLVRDARADLGAGEADQRRAPWPLRSTQSVHQCAEALLEAIERRRRRVYVPGGVALVQALRSVVLSPLGDALIRRPARTAVPALEARVDTLGRHFGRSSTGLGGRARSAPD